MSEVYVHNSGKQKEIDSEIIYLEFGLFFDGTLNNKNKIVEYFSKNDNM